MPWFIKNGSLFKKHSDIEPKGATFRYLLMGKNEALKKLNNSVTYDRGVL